MIFYKAIFLEFGDGMAMACLHFWCIARKIGLI